MMASVVVERQRRGQRGMCLCTALSIAVLLHSVVHYIKNANRRNRSRRKHSASFLPAGPSVVWRVNRSYYNPTPEELAGAASRWPASPLSTWWNVECLSAAVRWCRHARPAHAHCVCAPVSAVHAPPREDGECVPSFWWGAIKGEKGADVNITAKSFGSNWNPH
jgi:hypothetical protein